MPIDVVANMFRVSALPYRNLIAWQKAYALAMDSMDLCQSEFLDRNRWLRDQLARAAMSVPANITEGNGRSTPNDYVAFIDRARGSLFELDTWLLACRDRGYIVPDARLALELRVQELSAMLFSLATKLRAQRSLVSRHS